MEEDKRKRVLTGDAAGAGGQEGEKLTRMLFAARGHRWFKMLPT